MEKLAGVYDLPLILLPLDSDLLSMEDPNCFSVRFREPINGVPNFISSGEASAVCVWCTYDSRLHYVLIFACRTLAYGTKKTACLTLPKVL